MLIRGRCMFMIADSGTQTIPRFGSMPRTMASRSSRKIRIFRNEAFSSVSLQKSSGYAPRTAPPNRSRTSCGLLSQSSCGSSGRTKSRALSSESALGPDNLLGTLSEDKVRSSGPHLQCHVGIEDFRAGAVRKFPQPENDLDMESSVRNNTVR